MNRYWLTPAYEADFAVKVNDINALYKQAPELARQGQRVESTDEMTGVQALERTHPGLPLSPGHVERREFEYIRHGTLTFIFNFDIATGELVACTAGPTRNEQDFLQHIQGRITAEPQTIQWHFVCDNLNIHLSESLVRYVAEESDLDIDLGGKGKSGILKSKASRAELWYLEIQSFTSRILERPHAPDCLSLHTQTRFLDEPGRDLAQYFGAQGDQTRPLYFDQ